MNVKVNMNHFTKYNLLNIMLVAILFIFTGCSSAQVKPDVSLPDLGSQTVEEAPTPETPTVKEKAEIAESEPAEEEPPQPTAPVCAHSWLGLESLAPIRGVPNFNALVNQGRATFATSDNKNYELVNNNGQMSIVTPDIGTHTITSFCKEPDGRLTAKAQFLFKSVDITITPKGNRAFNIQMPNANIDATIQ